MKLKGIDSDGIERIAKKITSQEAETTTVPTWNGPVEVILSKEDPNKFSLYGYDFELKEIDLSSDYDIKERTWKIYGDQWPDELGMVYEFSGDALIAVSGDYERDARLGTDPRLVAAELLAMIV